jgi:hypothetical protein
MSPRGGDPAQPYWKVHYGIDFPWTPTAAGRRGCMVMLVGGLAIVVVALIVGALLA